MRTPTLRKYEKRLIEVNDQLCYFLFSDSEAQLYISDVSKGSDGLFTTDVFPKNTFSERIHIKVETLPSFREKAFHTLVGMSLIASVEYMLSYIDDIEKYRSIISPSVHDTITNKKPEEQLREKLKAWLGKDIDSALIKTIRYLRLRRNHIAHVREETSEGFTTLIKNDANFLNNYWGAKTTELYDFDFANKDYSLFSANEVFALINLTRVCMREVDGAISSSLTEVDIAQHEMREFLKIKSNNGLSLPTKIRKFRAFIKHRHGVSIQCSEDNYNSYVANA